jgi:two-component system nitrogen regulation sensor histidine kinase NtrY
LIGLSGDGHTTAALRMVPAGEWKTFEVKITPMHDANGEKAGKVVVLEDLTELLRAQNLAAWTEAARRLAHEIKNPLTPIRLAAERLVAKYAPGDESFRAALEQGAAIIVREVGAMQALVD